MSWISIKKLSLLLFTIAIITSVIVISNDYDLGETGKTETADDTKTYNPDNPDVYEGWNTGDIPPDADSGSVARNYNKIPQEHRNKITANQMTDLKHSQLDFNNMNHNELQKHLKTKYPDYDISPANGMSMTDDGKLNYAGSDIDVNSLPAGSKVEVRDGELLVNDDQYTNAKNIQGNPDGSISTDSADLIRSDGVRFINLSNSNIRTDDSYATIITNESLKITDNTGTVVYVNPIDKGIISVSKTPENNSYYASDETGFIKVDEQYTRFNITSAVLQYEDEIATANGTISLVVNKDKGFGCMEISPIGSYYKDYPNDHRKNFIVYVYLDDFNLCFKKTVFDSFLGELQEKSGLVDYLVNEIKINGKAKYKRFPFSDAGITEAHTKNVLDCVGNCSATIELDNDFLYVEELSVDSQKAVVNPAEDITIYEYPNASYFNLTKNNRANNIVLKYNNLFSGFSAVIENNIYNHKNLNIFPYDEERLLAFTDEYNRMIGEVS